MQLSISTNFSRADHYRPNLKSARITQKSDLFLKLRFWLACNSFEGHLCNQMFQGFARLLTILFLFAFTIEVFSGVTLEHSTASPENYFSAKITGGIWTDLLFEELNEAEEDISEIKNAALIFEFDLQSRHLISCDLTTLVRQYHFDLNYSIGSISKFLLNASLLI